MCTACMIDYIIKASQALMATYFDMCLKWASQTKAQHVAHMICQTRIARRANPTLPHLSASISMSLRFQELLPSKTSMTKTNHQAPFL